MQDVVGTNVVYRKKEEIYGLIETKRVSAADRTIAAAVVVVAAAAAADAAHTAVATAVGVRRTSAVQWTMS